MSKKNEEITMPQAYIGNQIHIWCEKGEFGQPLNVTNNKNVTIQGMKIATEGDNTVGENITIGEDGTVFGNCEKGGKCQLCSGQKIKWEEVNDNVTVGNFKTLNGASFFRCPYHSDEMIKISEHNQNQFDGKKAREDAMQESEKTPNPAELIKMLWDCIKNPEFWKAMRDEIGKELGHLKELFDFQGQKGNEILQNFDKFMENPNLETFGSLLKSTGGLLLESSGMGIRGTVAISEALENKVQELLKQGVPKESIKEQMLSFAEESVDNYVDQMYVGTDRRLSPETDKWLRDTYKQIVLGEGAKNSTFVGSGIEIGLGSVPEIAVMDARDLAINLTEDDFWGQVYSFLGLLGSLGDLIKKSPKLLNKIKDLLQKLDKFADANRGQSKLLDAIADGTRAGIKGVKAVRELKAATKARLIQAIATLTPAKMIVAKMKKIEYYLQYLLCKLTKNGCFVAGTLVKTEYGHKKIEDIKIGEKVYTLNLENQKFEYKIVLEIFKNKAPSTITIQFENEIEVETTPNHKFFVINREFIEARNLEIGDIVLNNNSLGKKITNIKYNYYFEKDVYNLFVEDNNNYFVSEFGVLVHNNSLYCSEKLKEFVYQLLEDLKNRSLTDEELTKYLKECFIYETLVFTEEGHEQIGNIKAGSKVYSYNEVLNRLEVKEVLKTFEHFTSKVLELFLENGEIIKTTKDHPFFVNNKYIYAKNLKEGDKLFKSDGTEVKLSEKREVYLEKDIKVYNFEVEDNHNYFVGKDRILVHNDKELFHNYESILDKTGNIRNDIAKAKEKLERSPSLENWLNKDNRIMGYNKDTKQLWFFNETEFKIKDKSGNLITKNTYEASRFDQYGRLDIKKNFGGHIAFKDMIGVHAYDLDAFYDAIGDLKIKEIGLTGKEVKKFFSDNNLTANHYWYKGNRGYQVGNRKNHKNLGHKGLNNDIFTGNEAKVYKYKRKQINKLKKIKDTIKKKRGR